MPERVALTGATGFVGGNLLAALTKRNISIRALTRRRSPHSSSVHWVRGDLGDARALGELVHNCTALIHCAGAVRGNSAEEFLETNLNGARRLIEQAMDMPKPPRILLISSLAARHPEYSWYAQSKFMAEELLMSTRYAGLARAIYRPTAIYGPGDRELRPLLRMMRHGLLLSPGAPETRLSLLHVSDLVAAILQWLTEGATCNGVFELDDGTAGGYSWQDIKAIGQQSWQRAIMHVSVPLPLLGACARVNLALARLLRYPAMLSPGKVKEITHKNWVCDNAPLTAALGWRPQISLAQALTRSLI